VEEARREEGELAVDAFVVRRMILPPFWGVYERVDGKLKLVSRHEKRALARDAKDQLVTEERQQRERMRVMRRRHHGRTH